MTATVERPPGTARTRSVLRGLRVGASLGVLLLMLAFAVVAVVVPKATGAVPLTVLSGSMEPAIPVGSLVVVRPVDPADVRIGDVVTFLPWPDDPTAVTHRVVAVEHQQDGTRRFVTQGDANGAPDEPIGEHQLRGTVWYQIPLLGHVSSAVAGGDHALLVVLVAGGFFAGAARLWVRAYRESRRRAPVAQRPERIAVVLTQPVRPPTVTRVHEPDLVPR